MICRGFDVISKAVGFLNSNQVSVLTCDKPLFDIAKKVQWNWSSNYGKKHLVVIVGGLHTERAVLKVVSKWVKDSGWTSALVQAGETTPETADFFLKASHVLCALHAHQSKSSVSFLVDHQLNILAFVRSLREENFHLYREACKSLAPWFIALDHPYYAHWLSAHICDMEGLESVLPSVAAEFRKEHFVLKKTPGVFSSISINRTTILSREMERPLV